MEFGAGSRYLRVIGLALGVVALVFLNDFRAYRNFAAPEAMDTAQLARNISDRHGYTTLCIRPFSLYLEHRHNEAQNPASLANPNPDWAMIKTVPHPDLANPPVYPLVLAALVKVLPFQYPVNLKSALSSNNGGFWWYGPDFLIALFNQTLLLVVVGLTFFPGKKLFDSNVAWLSAVLVLGCEMLWRFSASGLVHHAVAGNFPGPDTAPVENRTMRARTGPAGGPADRPGGGGGASDRRWRPDTLCLRLDDFSSGTFPGFVQRLQNMCGTCSRHWPCSP